MKLSVVAPVLNEEFFLPLYLESVLAYADEVILLDGGSTDRTKEVVCSFQQKDSRVKFLVQPQEGLPYSDEWNEGARRNLLLDSAAGDWVLVLDADEIMSDNFVSALPELMADQSVDIYGFGFVSFWGTPSVVRLNTPDDTHWSGITHRLFRNNGKIRHSPSRHHCPFLYEGRPVWELKERIAVRLQIQLLHYHYALGRRIKFNDNRRGDVNRYNNMGEPDWSFQPPAYGIKTEPFNGAHPGVIQKLLSGGTVSYVAPGEIPRQDLTGISFDRYQRFQALADMVNQLGEENLSILDAGLEDGDFSLFVPRHRVTWLDKCLSLDVADLPFPDQSFDVVLAVDVIGGMSPAIRRNFLEEVVRVARRRAIVTTPRAGALTTEDIIYRLTQNRYLKPHLEKGLPSEEELEIIFRELGLPYVRYPNSGLAGWLGMLLANYYVTGADERRLLNRFFNRNFALNENRYPCYRLIYELKVDEWRAACDIYTEPGQDLTHIDVVPEPC